MPATNSLRRGRQPPHLIAHCLSQPSPREFLPDHASGPVGREASEGFQAGELDQIDSTKALAHIVTEIRQVRPGVVVTFG